MIRSSALLVAALAAAAGGAPATVVEAGLSPYPKGPSGFHFNGSAADDVRNGLVELNAGVSPSVDLLEAAYKAGGIGIGVGVAYSAQIARGPLGLGVKWEHDIAANHTFRGDVVSANLTVGL
jgi:hypothetical protein